MGPRERRGESIGLYGLAIAVPNLIAVPSGVALVLDGHLGWVAWLAASPLLGVLLRAPRLVRSPGPRGRGPAGARRAPRCAALAPSVVLFVVTLAGGGLVTFLPIERPDGALATVALLLFGVTGALTRWRAGLLADRLGGRRLIRRALASGRSAWCSPRSGCRRGGWVVLGAAVFGAGFGAAQNLTLLSAFARAGGAGRRRPAPCGTPLRRRHRRRRAGAGPARRRHRAGLDLVWSPRCSWRPAAGLGRRPRAVQSDRRRAGRPPPAASG